jgi:hypothetical protein
MPIITLQQQQKVAMTCDEGITKVKGYNKLLIPKPMSTILTTLVTCDVKTNLFCIKFKYIIT